MTMSRPSAAALAAMVGLVVSGGAAAVADGPEPIPFPDLSGQITLPDDFEFTFGTPTPTLPDDFDFTFGTPTPTVPDDFDFTFDTPTPDPVPFPDLGPEIGEPAVDTPGDTRTDPIVPIAPPVRVSQS